MARPLERTEQENYYLRELVSGTFSNGERVENNVNKYASGKCETINDLLEKLNSMEGKFARLEENNTKYKQNPDHGGGAGGGGGGISGGGNHNDQGDGKRLKRNNHGADRTAEFEDRRAKNKPHGKTKLQVE